MMKILIALGASIVATAAFAQTTVTTTRTTPTHETTTVRTSERTHVEAREEARPRTHRVCKTKWRNHKRIRICRTVRHLG